MSKFDSHERNITTRETDKGKFASAKASPDSVSQGIKRKVDKAFGATCKSDTHLRLEKKMNENHDERGRFTSGDSVSYSLGGTTRSGSYVSPDIGGHSNVKDSENGMHISVHSSKISKNGAVSPRDNLTKVSRETDQATIAAHQEHQRGMREANQKYLNTVKTEKDTGKIEAAKNELYASEKAVAAKFQSTMAAADAKLLSAQKAFRESSAMQQTMKTPDLKPKQGPEQQRAVVVAKLNNRYSATQRGLRNQ